MQTATLHSGITAALHDSLSAFFCSLSCCVLSIFYLLATAADNPHAVMNYKYFDSCVLRRYSVKLFGWPEDVPFASPSDISNCIKNLRKLKTAIDTKECGFHAMTSAEKCTFESEYQRHITNGELSEPVWATRKDAGKKRSHAVLSSDDDEASAMPPPANTESVATSAGKRSTTHPCYSRNSDSESEGNAASKDDYLPDNEATTISAASPRNSDQPACHPSDIPPSSGPQPRGEVLCDGNGRRIYSATPPATLAVGKCCHQPSSRSQYASKENVPVS
jgi:hypothetical protein